MRERDKQKAGIAELATLTAEPMAAMREVPRVAHRIARYSVLRELGSGSMGVVYAAYDETLDRRVALKLLRHQTSAEARARLVREAQALARLSHPNVVQVYEIGEHEGAAFIAMEFVDGGTLTTWLGETKRGRAEILAAFSAAGAGLAAAHAKGLVHRDFKPDNVMVARDGRVAVTDFGLAHTDGDEAVRARLERAAGASSSATLEDAVLEPSDTGMGRGAANSLTVDLTATGTLLGTPAYMAPEQYSKLDVDARSDQFSFCVALWEALYGERPYQERNLAALARAITTGARREPPRDAEVPSWLRRVVERGLALRPEDRWPSMAALEAALRRDPTRRRGWLLGAVVGLGLALAIGVSVRKAREAQARAALEAQLQACAGAGAALVESWSPERAAELEGSFAAELDAVAQTSWTRTQAHLDAYAQAWSAQRERLCVEDEVEGSRDRELAARELECLEERRDELSALARAVVGAEPADLSDIVTSAATLTPLTRCSDPRWLRSRVRPPSDDDTRARVDALRSRLRQNQGRQAVHTTRDSLAPAEQLLAEAEALGWPPLIAQAQLELGDIRSALGDHEEAEALSRQAFGRAIEAGDDLLAIDAALTLTHLAIYHANDYTRGQLWSEWAATLTARLGLTQTSLGAFVRTQSGWVQHALGEPEAALELYAEALALYDEQLGPEHPDVAQLLNRIGTSQAKLGRYADAIGSYERAIQIYASTIGAEHPEVGALWANLATAQNRTGRKSEAVASLERARAIYAADRGPDSPELAAVLHNQGLMRHALKEYERARAESAPARTSSARCRSGSSPTGPRASAWRSCSATSPCCSSSSASPRPRSPRPRARSRSSSSSSAPSTRASPSPTDPSVRATGSSASLTRPYRASSAPWRSRSARSGPHTQTSARRSRASLASTSSAVSSTSPPRPTRARSSSPKRATPRR